jgi:hypothetical protein
VAALLRPLFSKNLSLTQKTIITVGSTANEPPPVSVKSISGTIQSKKRVFRQCYKDFMPVRQRHKAWRMKAFLILQGDGRLVRATVESSSRSEPELENCILHTLHALQFPSIAADPAATAEITYPFNFSAVNTAP